MLFRSLYKYGLAGKGLPAQGRDDQPQQRELALTDRRP